MQKNQWKRYQSLELIPPTLNKPSEIKLFLIRPLTYLWRSLVNQSARQFTLFEQVEHLEICLTSEATEPLLPNNEWNFLMYLTGGLSVHSEPNIWQTTDYYGQQLWHIYDPRTGKTTHWDTEDEVRTWLENRYHR